MLRSLRRVRKSGVIYVQVSKVHLTFFGKKELGEN